MQNDKDYIINKLKNNTNLNILVIGDVMIDSYLWGKVDRISPEAPVPIVSVKKRENRLGGAANVALNLKSLGANPILCSVIGDDEKGKSFLSLLSEQHINSTGIIASKERITTVKFRVIGNNFQMLRVDEEIDNEINEQDSKNFIQLVSSIIDNKKIDAIVFEDYDKGVITEKVINYVVNLAQDKNIPTVVDPKKRNFSHYKNVTLFKPNLKELKEGLKLDVCSSDKESLKKAHFELLKLLNAKLVMITLSEHGIILFNKNNLDIEEFYEKAHLRNIADVSGAGDTVISVTAICLALNFSPPTTIKLANIAGGLVCEEVGVVPINKQKFITEIEKLL